MVLLGLIQEFCKRRSLPVPTSGISNSDPGVMQIIGILNEFLEDLQTRKVWQRNTVEATFVSTASEDQGDINTICPYGFEEILWETFFDRTQRLPIRGAVSAAEWQARKAFNITGPWYQFRLRQNRLLFTPALPVSRTIAFEYNSSYFVKDTALVAPAAGAYKQYWANDLDTCTLGDALPLSYLSWAWAAKKGFDYAEAFNAYERLIAVKNARDNRPMAVNLGDTSSDLRPGVFVPSGNWLQP